MEKEHEASGSERQLGIEYETISKETADAYVKAWQSGKYVLVPSSQKKTSPQILPLDSFLFSIDDFKDFVARVDLHNETSPAEGQVTGVVCRMGIKPNPLPTTDFPEVPGLFFQPIIGFKKDPLNPGLSLGEMVALNGAPQGILVSARYDFSYPCPPTCAGGQIG